MTQRPTLVDKYKVRAGKMRAAGMTYNAIAERLNISHGTAYSAAKDTLVKTVMPVVASTVDAKVEAKAKKLRLKGMIYKDIADKLQIPESTAWRICNREASRKHGRDSNARYRARGNTAIVDISPTTRWLKINYVSGD